MTTSRPTVTSCQVPGGRVAVESIWVVPSGASEWGQIPTIQSTHTWV